MATVEERVSFIEGRFETLATKGDLLKAVLALATMQVVSIGVVAALVSAL